MVGCMIGVPVFQEVSTGLVYCQFVELASDVVFGQECTDALIQTVVVQKWVLESVGCDLPGFSDFRMLPAPNPDSVLNFRMASPKFGSFNL